MYICVVPVVFWNGGKLAVTVWDANQVHVGF